MVPKREEPARLLPLPIQHGLGAVLLGAGGTAELGQPKATSWWQAGHTWCKRGLLSTCKTFPVPVLSLCLCAGRFFLRLASFQLPALNEMNPLTQSP